MDGMTQEQTRSLYEAGSIILGDVPHPPVRASFINVFEAKVVRPRGVAPRPASDRDNPQFDVTMFMPLDHPQVQAVREILMRVAAMKWPGQTIDWRNPAAFVSPVKVGDQVADKGKALGKDNEFYRGHLVIRAHTSAENPPPLAVSVSGRVVPYTDPARRHEAKSHFYPGCLIAADVSFIPYIGPTGINGVTCYLNSLLALPGGDRLAIGTRAAPEQTFSKFQGRVTGADPTGGAGVAAELAALGIGGAPGGTPSAPF